MLRKIFIAITLDAFYSLMVDCPVKPRMRHSISSPPPLPGFNFACLCDTIPETSSTWYFGHDMVNSMSMKYAFSNSKQKNNSFLIH